MNVIRILVALIGLSLTAMSATAAEGIRVWQNSAGAGFPQFHAAMVANGHANDQAISTNALGLQAFVFAQSNGYLERVPKANRNPASYAALFRRWNGLSAEVISVEQFRAKGAGNGFWLPVLDSPAVAPTTELTGDIEAITASIRAMTERLAALEAEKLSISDVFGLERELGELADSIPDLGPLQGSVAELTRFMQALKAGDTTEIKALQGNLVAAVEADFNARLTALEESLNALDARIDAEATARTAGDAELGDRITALTAEGGAITLLQAAMADVTGEGGDLAQIWAELDTLTKDGGRLAVIEGQLVALDSQGRQIADLDRSIDVLADWVETNQAAFEALTTEGGRLSVVEENTSTNAGEITELREMIKALQSNFMVWGGAGLLVVLGLALVGSHFLDKGSKRPTEARVKRLEYIELADLEWRDDNPDLASLSNDESIVGWHVRQKGTDKWVLIEFMRRPDTPDGQVMVGIPKDVGGKEPIDPVGIEDVPMQILAAIKDGRVKPIGLEAIDAA